MIVIEGPDVSGKSTLASFLGEATGCPVQRSEGPPKFSDEINQRLQRYSLLPRNTIFDRHPVVSERIYARALGRTTDINVSWTNQFYYKDPLIIYCDPVDELMDGHQIKEHDEPDFVERLNHNFAGVIAAYREWAIGHATVIYRIGDDMNRILHFVTDFTGDIDAFHQRFGIAYDGRPRPLSKELREFRVVFMAEELCEYCGVDTTTRQLIQSALVSSMNNELPLQHQFDALIDLAYVALGTSHMHGFPFKEGWSRVHQANMTKVRVKNADESTRASAFDVCKPEGWRPPVLEDLLR